LFFLRAFIFRTDSSSNALALAKLSSRRAKSEFFTNRDGDATPTLSERKKSVSFCDPLEEVFYVESFKIDRAKS